MQGIGWMLGEDPRPWLRVQPGRRAARAARGPALCHCWGSPVSIVSIEPPLGRQVNANGGATSQGAFQFHSTAMELGVTLDNG